MNKISLLMAMSAVALGSYHTDSAAPISSAEATTAEGPASAVIFHNIMVPMRDGVRLATNIYIPGNHGAAGVPGRYPTLLLRTPYGKKGWSSRPSIPAVSSEGVLFPSTATSHGYVIVYQDVRGTSDSEGTLIPMLNEGDDGYDTVEWLRKQPWSDGRVGTFGPSYMGGDQMLLTAERPTGLVAAFSQIPATDMFNNEWVYMDGVMPLTAVRWTFSMVSRTFTRLPESERKLLRADCATLGIADPKAIKPTDVDQILGALPLREMPVVRLAPWWPRWLSSWNDPGYFRKAQMDGRYDKINVPILHLGGWYDLFLRNTYENFEKTSTQANGQSVRANQRLVIGPWSHVTCIGFPSNADVDTETMQLAWMDQWFKGRKDPFFNNPVVLYVMGENRWRSEEHWPLVGTMKTRYYLHSAGHANSSNGNGSLTTSSPDAEEADQYRYDPRDPAPTLGGIGLTGSRAVQNDAEQRADVLVYSSPILTEAVEVTGEVGATIYAASSATDTDWWVKLVDVEPGGEAYILDQGVARSRYRHSRTHPEPLTPGKVETFEINMWATSNVFKAGHRIRLEVSSSNFPYADRNPNAFVDLATATERNFVVASQIVYHDLQHSSCIELPIIPWSRERKWIETPFPRPADVRERR